LAQLRAARNEFFETRVTGRAEVWAAIKLVCEMVEQGELNSAQAVLDASGCTCPSGEIWGRKGGVFDERGERYVVSDWVVGRPAGLAAEDDEGQPHYEEETGELASVVEGEDDVEKEDDDDDEEEGVGEGAARGGIVSMLKRKGKARVLNEEIRLHGREMKVKARLSHNARDIMVKIGVDDSIDTFIKIVRREAEVCLWERHLA
jgi:hypothetical protein